MKLAVFAIDPGKTTGLAWGIFERKKSTMLTLSGGVSVGGAQVQGRDSLDTAHQIVEKWEAFGGSVGIQVGSVQNVLIIEDFILRPQTATSSREMLTPVEITGMIRGILWEALGVMGPNIVFQMPSEAKGFATNERLGRWGVPKEIVGRHSKDAWRHIAVYLAKRSQQQSQSQSRSSV